MDLMEGYERLEKKAARVQAKQKQEVRKVLKLVSENDTAEGAAEVVLTVQGAEAAQRLLEIQHARSTGAERRSSPLGKSCPVALRCTLRYCYA